MGQHEVVIAADIGGTTVSAGIVGSDGTVQTQRQAGTYARGAGAAVVENIVELLGTGRAEAPSGAPVLGVGIGAPGNVDAAAGWIGEDIQNIPEFGEVSVALRGVSPATV